MNGPNVILTDLTLYVIPDECPFSVAIQEGPIIEEKRDDIVSGPHWTTITQASLRLLTRGDYPPNLECQICQAYASWTCIGCSVGLGGREEPCPARKCGLGGGLLK